MRVQYVKIKEALLEQIDTGMLAAGQKLPAERKLAETFDTTRVTLREALSLLESEGRIYREDRRGWFISPQPVCYNPALALTFEDIAIAANRKFGSELISAKTVLATKQASELLALPPFSEVHRLERVRYLDDRPVVYMTHFIKSDPFPNLLNFDLSVSLTNVYHEYFNICYGRTRYCISITSLVGDMAHALRATSGSPAMLVKKFNYDQHGTLIDCCLEYWRHDVICIESEAEFS